MLENYLRMIYTSGDYEIQREDLDEPYCYMSDEDEILFYYMLTALDTDRAIGQLKKDLAQKGLLEDTVIVLFGDHNAYYHELSNYVKDIEDYDTDRKFTDLYNVPLMIYNKGWSDQMSEEERVINKFTCTADIVPTLLDLLGINYYSNLYYGNSIFSDKQSVLYTRAYDNFISDGIVSRSVNKMLYRDKSVTDAQFNAYKTEATALVQKIKYCDYIFKQDYFGTDEKLALFQENMRQLNN
jgi:phosphoglycerol transferase MdoB-like AlkP superfamily enzyme